MPIDLVKNKHNIHIIQAITTFHNKQLLENYIKSLEPPDLFGSLFMHLDEKILWENIIGNNSREIIDINGKPRICCGICFSDYEEKDIFEFQCKHKFCNKCLGSWFSIQHAEGFRVPTCAEPECKQKLDLSELRKCLAPMGMLSLCDKFEEFETLAFLSSQNDFIFCPHGCGSGGVYNKECQNWTCIDCKYNFCTHCLAEYHLNSCEEESENDNWKRNNNVKLCPKCGISIQKTEGCSHMTCTCKYQFCYICLGPYKGTYVQTGTKCNCKS